MIIAEEFDGAACVIDCQPRALSVIDLDLTCVPQQMEEETLASMVRLLATADEADDDLPDPFENEFDFEDEAGEALDIRETQIADEVQAQVVSAPAGSGGVNEAHHEEQPVLSEPQYEILVRLLGEIRVEGGKPLRPKPTAVVAFISLHRSVAIETLEDACWADPASGSLRKRLKDVMSECRAGIGSQNLPASSDGRYTVGPGVITDTELFDLRVARAASQPPAQQAETYRSALELVTGKVFTYPSRAGSSFGWIDTENLLSQWEVKIQGIAQQCIETYLTIGAPEKAAEIAVHVLKALPLNTALTEALMRAHAATGDLKAVDTVYRAHSDGLRRILNADPEDSTVQLHRDLTLARVH